jgi:hypothetical protein
MKKISAVFGLAFVLAACSSEQAPPPVAVNHTLEPKIVLNVKTISLTDRSGMQPADSLYNGNSFTPTIKEAIKQWAIDRMQANGQSGQAVVIIKKASLTSQPLEVKKGFFDFDRWFTRQQSAKYIGSAEVSIEANGPTGYAITEASATRALTLPEDPTAAEKQNAYYTLLNGLIKDLGENLESGIHEHMSGLIETTPVLGATAVPIGSPAADKTPAPAAQPMVARDKMTAPPSSGGASPAIELVPPGE